MRYSNVAMFALMFVAAPSVHGHLNDTSVNRELKAETKLRRGPPVDPLDGGPRFRKGEIIVKGSPLDLPPGVKVIRYLKKSNLTVIKVTRGREKAIVEKLKKKKVMAEPNFEVFASAVTPNDSYLNYQWHFDKVQARDAWEHTTGQGIIVAVLDTGLALTGNDGIGCVRTDLQRNTHDDNFNVHDGDGHGTHVTGTVAQRTNNGIGVAGLAYGACIMPVKVLGDDGSGTIVDIAEGIYWAVDKGAHVINMSLGVNAASGKTSDGILDPALQYAFTQGVTVVAAAGNDSFGDNVSYPSSYPTVISVGATDSRNSRSFYSNYGTGLDIMAPGGDTGVDRDGDGNVDDVLQETMSGGTVAYRFYQGTSMASPHVAAACAMIISSGVASSPTDVKNVLKATALNIGNSNEYGAGLIQVNDAVTFSTGTGTTRTPNPTPGPTASPTRAPTTAAPVHPTPNPTPAPTPLPTKKPTQGECLAVRGATCGGSLPPCCSGLYRIKGRRGRRDQCK